MPIQAPQWVDYLNCPACCREFGQSRSPVSLGCGHTLCKPCIKNLHKKQCPFEQTVISVDLEELVTNTALLQLAGYTPPAQPYHPPSIQALSDQDRHAYDVVVKCLEQLAVFLKYCGNGNTNTGSRLSRPMQRKLVTLLQCAITDEEGRGKAARAARSLGDRTVTELIVQHQNPQQLSANLWAAVRSRGCQFLGPAMQEEVLKLVLLALEDGSALSRKVLVMFVVQRLEPHFPQASKTSIGHVVQLLYRASCFKVSKRVCDSSLMQLKEEFRTYESLRREHDAQIVQIATEAGLRIAPDQWSALLYGDSQHKSHMQSIIDKLQTPQSFAQSVQELFITLQRTGDPAQLIALSAPLDRLANIDASPDAKSPNWQQLSVIMTSLKSIVSRLVHFMQEQSNANRDANLNLKADRSPETPTQQLNIPGVVPGRYKVAMCRDAQNNTYCPRGNNCTYAHSEEELDRYRRINSAVNTGSYQYVMQAAIALPRANFQRYSVPPPPLPSMEKFALPPMQQQVSPSLGRPLDREQPYNVQCDQGYQELQRDQTYEPAYDVQHDQTYDQHEPSYQHQREQAYSHIRESSYEQVRDQKYEQGRDQTYEQGRDQTYEQGRDQTYEQGRDQTYEQGRDQSYEQGCDQSYEQACDQSYEHGRDLPYDHREQSYEHPPPNVSADNYGGSYANALMHGTDNMVRAIPNQINPQHQNGNVNTVMGHGVTPGHFFSQYMDPQAAYPYLQQLENGMNNDEMAQYSGMAGQVGSVDPNHPEYQQQAFVNGNGAGCHYETITYGITVNQQITIVQPMAIAQPKEQTWANITVKSPPMFKFDEMAKNLPIGMEHGKTIPIGMDMLKNKPIGMEIAKSAPIVMDMGNNMPAVGQNMQPIGKPTNGDMMHPALDLRVQQNVVRTANQHQDDQELEKELKALEQRIDSEFCHAVDPLAPVGNAIAKE